jgi:hypothetical protein
MYFSPLNTNDSSKAVMVRVENIAPFFLSTDYETIGTTVVLDVENNSMLFTISLHPKDARTQADLEKLAVSDAVRQLQRLPEFRRGRQTIIVEPKHLPGA